MSLLKLDDVRTSFPVRRRTGSRTGGLIRAVDGVSFGIPRGTTLGLVGESGCGKTTLGRTILRLVEATSGRVWFDGVDVLSASRTALRGLRGRMQLVFQDASGTLNPRMAVGRSIAEPLVVQGALRGRRVRERVATLLETVGLRPADADRYPHELSGGQRQRVGIARAVALQPEFVVCDEPVSALDVSIQSQVLNLLGDLKKKLALTYLFIAHDLAVVKHFSDRVAVMYLGRIVEIAEASDLYGEPRHPYTSVLLSSVPDPDPTCRRERLAPSGDVPNPIDPPSGCAFHPRCVHATDECRRTTPRLEAHPTPSADHLVACHHADTISVDRRSARGDSVRD